VRGRVCVPSPFHNERETWHLNVWIPPTWHMCIVIPVFPALLSVDIGVHPSFAAGSGTGHCELGRSMSSWSTTFHFRLLGDGLERSAQTYGDAWRCDLCVELNMGVGRFCPSLTHVRGPNASAWSTRGAYTQHYDEGVSKPPDQPSRQYVMLDRQLRGRLRGEEMGWGRQDK